MPDCVVILILGDVVGRVAVAEAVRKDLVHYGALCPGGNMDAGDEAEGGGD